MVERLWRKLPIRKWDPIQVAEDETGNQVFHVDIDRLDLPMRWTKRWHTVCCSEVDLFDPKLYHGALEAVFAVMVISIKQHFTVVTEYPERAWQFLKSLEDTAKECRYSDNPLWWQVDNGVTRFITDCNQYGPGSYDVTGLLDASEFTRLKRFRKHWHWNPPQYGDFGRIELGGYWEWTGTKEEYPFNWPPPNIEILKPVASQKPS